MFSGQTVYILGPLQLVYCFLNPLGLVAIKWAVGKEMLGYL